MYGVCCLYIRCHSLRSAYSHKCDVVGGVALADKLFDGLHRVGVSFNHLDPMLFAHQLMLAVSCFGHAVGVKDELCARLYRALLFLKMVMRIHADGDVGRHGDGCDVSCLVFYQRG